MGNNRPIKCKDWIKFLDHNGCEKLSHNGTSHEQWKCPNCIRRIVFRSQYKDIPAFHLRTNLKTMGMKIQELYVWIDNN